MMILNTLRLARNAVTAVPVVRFALGLAGIAIFFAIVRGAIPDVSIVKMFPLMAGIMGLMLLLILLATAAEAKERISHPALLLVWTITLCVIVILGAGVSALLIGKPERFAKLILPEAAADKPLLEQSGIAPLDASSARERQHPATTVPAPAKTPSVIEPQIKPSPTDSGTFKGITVIYYAKGLDTTRLAAPLRQNGVPYSIYQA